MHGHHKDSTKVDLMLTEPSQILRASLYPALVAAFLFGISTTAVLVTAGPLAFDSTSREFVGRVTAVINPLGRLAALISVALAGFLVSTVLRLALWIRYSPVWGCSPCLAASTRE